MNPNQYKTIGKDVYYKLNDVLLRGFASEFNSKDLSWDMREDFKHQVGILFCEFYDSFFELFDTLVEGKDKF